MSGGNMKVNPSVLQRVGTAFGQAGDGMAGLQADAPLGDAASSVAQLQTANACRKAQSDLAAQTAALADDAREYGENLHTAAGWYNTRDEASAEAIKKVSPK